VYRVPTPEKKAPASEGGRYTEKSAQPPKIEILDTIWRRVIAAAGDWSFSSCYRFVLPL
jgi:hypothetical protein